MDETRVALMGIIVENEDAVAQLNELLHGCGGYIIGRMGLPYRARGVNIISVVLDAPQDVISKMCIRDRRWGGRKWCRRRPPGSSRTPA